MVADSGVVHAFAGEDLAQGQVTTMQHATPNFAKMLSMVDGPVGILALAALPADMANILAQGPAQTHDQQMEGGHAQGL